MKIPFTKFFIGEEKKNYNVLPFFGQSGGFGYTNLSFTKALNYYERIAPVATCVDMVTDNVAQLKVVLYDKQKDEFVPDHDVLKLLNAPNTDETGTEYMKALSTFFVLTGNTYTVGTGENKNQPPKELFVINPTDVSIASNKMGFAGAYTVTMDSNTNEVYKEQIVKSRSRFYSADGELWHIRKFNPYYGSSNLYGLSTLCPIFYEIEQYQLSSIHNASVLQKGARPSMALISKTSMSDDQYEKFRADLKNVFQNATNAGEVFVLEGGDSGMEIKELSLTNKDMDFFNLKKDSMERICNRLNVPLPLVTQDAATMNNTANAMLFLYDQAVLPLADRLFEELSLFLLPRFKLDPNRYQLTYDESEITALEPRRTENLNKIRDLGVLSTNELRTEIGRESIGPDGDTIFVPSALLPLGQDQVTEDNLTKPVSKVKSAKVKTTLGNFRDIMLKHGYSEEEIKEAWEKKDDTDII